MLNMPKTMVQKKKKTLDENNRDRHIVDTFQFPSPRVV